MKRRNLIRCAVACVAIGGSLAVQRLSASAREPAKALALPAVSLMIDVEGHYRDGLKDLSCATTCDAVRNALRDSVREVFAASYPFLRWQSGSAPDTVEVRLSNRQPTLYLRSQLEFRIRGRQPWMKQSAFVRDFEDLPDFEARDNAGWRPEVLVPDLSKKLRDATLDDNLLVEVFGRIPHVIPVRFPVPGTAIVEITEATLKPAPAMRPAFELVTIVKDTVKQSEDSADAKLTGCTKTPQKTYTCDIVELRYASKTLTGDSLRAVLGRATIEPALVRLIEYRADKNPAARPRDQ
jgi:hypothetical protein